MDETTIRVLDPGRGKTRTGYLSTMARDDRRWGGPDPPGVVYTYARGRGGHHGEKVLEGFVGTLQIDGYAGYRWLSRLAWRKHPNYAQSPRKGASAVTAQSGTNCRRDRSRTPHSPELGIDPSMQSSA